MSCHKILPTVLYPIFMVLVYALETPCVDLVVNDFANPLRNNLQGTFSDDKTMNVFSISNGLQLKPNPNSYYYETGFCPKFQQWSGIAFNLTLQPGSLFLINVQTASSCSSKVKDNYIKSTDVVDTGGIIRVPFPENMDYLIAVSLSNFRPFGDHFSVHQVWLSCNSIHGNVSFSETKLYVEDERSTVLVYLILSLLAFVWSLI